MSGDERGKWEKWLLLMEILCFLPCSLLLNLLSLFWFIIIFFWLIPFHSLAPNNQFTSETERGEDGKEYDTLANTFAVLCFSLSLFLRFTPFCSDVVNRARNTHTYILGSSVFNQTHTESFKKWRREWAKSLNSPSFYSLHSVMEAEIQFHSRRQKVCCMSGNNKKTRKKEGNKMKATKSKEKLEWWWWRRRRQSVHRMQCLCRFCTFDSREWVNVHHEHVIQDHK